MRKLAHLSILFSVVVMVMIAGCTPDYVPKPRGFQRIDLPPHRYTPYTSDCGFTFETPTYSKVSIDNHPTAEKCWYNVLFTPFDATLHLSYKDFKTKTELVKLTEDSRTLVYKHTIKADEIYETQITNAYLNGMLYELSGNTATNFQFFVHDSSGHFMRGALYFNGRTNNDSVAPAMAHLKEDIMHSLESLRWK